MSEQPNSKLSAALVKFQAEAPTITKNKEAKVATKTGGSYKYKYADIGDILSAIQGKLGKHGLAWTSRPITALGSVEQLLPEPVLYYSLVHESGEREDGFMPLGLPADWTPQQLGSALTYARRYAMSAQLGLATEEDDDGSAASDKPFDKVAHASPRSTEKPVARKVEKTETPCSAKQRGLINKHAGTQGVPATVLANLVQKVMGVEKTEWKDELQAERWYGRAIERFPASKVDALLAEIDLQETPIERSQMKIDEVLSD